MANLQDFKTFFEEIPVALIRIDAKTGEMLMANRFAASLFGYESIEELKVNCKTIDCYSPEGLKLVSLLKKKRIVENYELEVKLPQRSLWVNAKLRYCPENDFFEGAVIDITDWVKCRNANLPVLQEVAKKLDKRIAALAS